MAYLCKFVGVFITIAYGKILSFFVLDDYYFLNTFSLLHAGSRVSNLGSNIKVKARKCKLINLMPL